MADPIDWDKLAPELLAGGAGTVDELLYGIPEYVAKKIDRKAVEDYIGKHKQAYKTGETIGTVGSIFMPVPGGAAIKGLDTASDILRLAGRGALAGAGEAGLRGITSEKNIGEIMRDIQRGATWGGVGGAAGGLIGKALPRGAKAAEKYTAKQYLRGRGINTKALKSAFMQSMPRGAGDAYKAQRAGEYLRDFSDFAKTVPRGEGIVEEMSKQTTDMYKILNDAWGGKMGNATAADVIKGLIHPDDIARITEEYGDDAAKGAIDYVTSQAAGKTGLVGIKKYFERIGDAARTNPKLAENVQLSAAIQDLAYGLKGKADDVALAAAESMGKGVNIADLKRKYKYLKPFEKAEVAETFRVAGPGGGSPTFEKRSIADLASALGAPAVGAAIGGGSAALSPEEGKEKIKNIILGSLGGAAITKGLSMGSSRAIGGLDTLASKAAQKIGQVAPGAVAKYGAAAGGQAASIIARKAIGEAKPETPEQAEAAQTGASAGTGDTPAYMTQIMDRMQMYAQVKGVSVDSPEFAQFAQQVYQLTEGFAPEKVAGILYPGEAERKAYLTALTASRRLAEVMPTATAERPGFWQSESTEAGMARSAAVDQLAAIVGDVAKEKGSEAAAKKQLNKILAGRETPERKAQLVKTLLAQYGVDLEKLSAMGVV